MLLTHTHMTHELRLARFPRLNVRPSQPSVGQRAGNHDVLLADKIRLTLEEEEVEKRCSGEKQRER